MVTSSSLLSEGISEKLFHKTQVESLAKILKQNKFLLTTDFGISNERRHRDDYKNSRTKTRSSRKLYYMSFMRSIDGKYLEPTQQTSFQSTIVMDGRKLMADGYSGNAMDFFYIDAKFNKEVPGFLVPDEFFDYSKNYGNKKYMLDEMEDRMYSYSPTLPNAKKYILEIHVLANPKSSHYASNYEEFMHVESIKKMADAHTIPIYVHDDVKNYKVLRKKDAWSSVQRNVPDRSGYDAKKRERSDRKREIGSAKIRTSSSSVQDRYLFASYTELLLKNDESELSKDATDLLYSIKNSSETDSANAIGDVIDAIENVRRNSRHGRRSLDKFLKKAQSLRIYTLRDYMTHVARKYQDSDN